MNARAHILRTLLVHAANEGFRTGRIDPVAPNSSPGEPCKSILFDAPLGAIPMRVSISGWRSDELRIAAAVWPTPDADEWIDCMTAKAIAGDATVIGHLERRNGHVSLSNPFEQLVFIRKNRKAALLALPMPNDASDPYCLYPRYLRFGSAA